MHHPRELEAFEGTYEWIFEDGRTSFSGWARSEESLFWITGKAGSGKSTLMRLLSEHEETQDLLQEWAGSSEVVLLSFFFWNAGNTMQKSQIGLMRALLHQLLDQSEGVDLERIAPSRKTSSESA